MMQKQRKQSFWHNESDYLPDIVVNSIKSFIDAKCNYHLYTYKEYKNMPEGTIIEDANKIVPYKNIFKDCRNGWTIFADYFRIFLVNKVDTAWTDADNIFFNDDFATNNVLIIQDGRIQNGFFYLDNSDKSLQFKRLLLDSVLNPTIKHDFDSDKLSSMRKELISYNSSVDIFKNSQWGFLGSELFTSIYKYLNFGNAYDYYKYFNNYHFSEQYKLFINKYTDDIHERLKNIKILCLSYNLLSREKWICDNIDNNSFVSKMLRNEI